MEENIRAPFSVSPNSENESLENRPVIFSTLPGISSMTVGANSGYMDSHTTTNEKLMMPPPRQPSTFRQTDPPQEPTTEDITASSSKKPVDTLIEPILIEISAGEDIVETLINLARFHQVGIIVLSGFGPVYDVTLLHPMSNSPAFLIQGPFNMLSLSGTYINPNCGHVPPRFITDPPCSSFSIFLDGSHNHVFGGIIGGKVTSAGVVLVTAALIKKFEFHHLIERNRKVWQFEDDHPTYIGGVIFPNVDHVEPEHNNNNVFQASGSSVVSANQTQMNNQMLPPPLPTNFNVMQWNPSTCSYHNKSQQKDS